MMQPSTMRWATAMVVATLASWSVAASPDPSRPTTSTADNAAPIGALWISAVGAPYRDQLRMDRFVQELRRMPFTEFLIQVRANADAYYDSKLVPRATGVPAQFDPLAELIAEMHRDSKSKKLIAWFDPYHAGNLNDASPLPTNHVLLEHQDWLSLREDRDSADANGDLFLEPGLPEVQQHLEAAIQDLVRRYKIDGLYLAHMGDPPGDGKWGFHPDVLDRWRADNGGVGAPEAGDPRWQAFRARILTDALAGLIRAAHAVRPDLPIGVDIDAVGPPPAGAEDFYRSAAFAQTRQDYPRWLQLDGLDRFYIKNFQTEESGRPVFDGWLKLALSFDQSVKARIVIGVDGSRNDAIDALAQLRRAAETGAMGLALWHYAQPVRDAGSRELFLSAVGRTVLSPEYLRLMANINRTRSEPVRLAVISKSDDRLSTAAAARATPAPAPELPLPPPPVMAEVPVESDTTITTGSGRLLSARPGTTPSDAAADDADTMAALDRLLGNNAASATPTPAAPRVTTRQELIDEFLNDPLFRDSANRTYFWGTEGATRELKRKFGNIF